MNDLKYFKKNNYKNSAIFWQTTKFSVYWKTIKRSGALEGNFSQYVPQFSNLDTDFKVLEIKFFINETKEKIEKITCCKFDVICLREREREREREKEGERERERDR